VSGGLLPAARTPYGNEMTVPAGGSSTRSETPVFDALVAEWRKDFRAVPGDPWNDFTQYRTAGSDRHSLPGGSSFAY
jgi:hypothetical protein